MFLTLDNVQDRELVISLRVYRAKTKQNKQKNKQKTIIIIVIIEERVKITSNSVASGYTCKISPSTWKSK